MATLIKRFGSYPLCSRAPQFRFVVEAVVGQQLSAKAADSILKRLKVVCGGGRITAKRILGLSLEELKTVGLSRRKAETIQAFARAVEENVIRLNAFLKMSDEDIQNALTSVKGIGPWTVEMLLIFAMARPDVFSLHDGALKSVIGELYKVDTARQDVLLEVSNKWRPYRSIACWYLYKQKNSSDG